MIEIRTSSDGHVYAVASVRGIAVYLDTWAYKKLSTDSILRERFLTAMDAARATLLVSVMNMVELGSLRGASANRARAFLDRIGVNWLPLDINVWRVASREPRMPDACVASQLLDLFFGVRCTELEMDGHKPFGVCAESIYRLGCFMEWVKGREGDLIALGHRLDETYSNVHEAYRQNHARVANWLDSALPPIPWDIRFPARFVASHLTRLLVHESKGYQPRAGDGRDFCHAAMAAAYASIAALDKQWKRRIESLPLPNGIAKIYYEPEFEQLLRHLEGLNASRPFVEMGV